jgi:hypothetical protein
VTEAGSPNRTTLYALYMALNHVSEPCNILVHSKISLGFKNPKQSSNKELIFKIMSTVNKAGHLIAFDITDDFGRVNIWEELYGKPVVKDNKAEKTAKPKIENKQTPNDVFDNHQMSEKEIEEMAEKHQDWKSMYSDLMGESNGSWVPGSGGY